MPKKIILIAAVTVDGYIARHSKEITTWSKDIHVFKEQTIGHSIIVGSNTYKTLQNELMDREIYIVKRNDKPREILSQIKKRVCFVIGGGRTFAKYASFITHLFITPHPHVFGSGVRLFSDKIKEMRLGFIKIKTIDQSLGIYQYQYKVIN